jgi:hypothetical protein
MWIVWIVDCGLWIVTGLRSQLSAQSVRAERGEGKVPMGECGAGRGRKGKGPSGFAAAFADCMRGPQVGTWLVGMYVWDE